MSPEEIFKKLQDEFGEEALFDFDDGTGKSKDPFCFVAPFQIQKICARMKSDEALHFDYLESLTAVDWPKEDTIQVVYHLYSYPKRHRMIFKANLDRADPVIPTLFEVWRAAGWHERECFDLFGVMFDGHPDLRRLLLPEDWEGHPLRKDYQQGEVYNGIPTTRANVLDILGTKVPESD